MLAFLDFSVFVILDDLVIFEVVFKVVTKLFSNFDVGVFSFSNSEVGIGILRFTEANEVGYVVTGLTGTDAVWGQTLCLQHGTSVVIIHYLMKAGSHLMSNHYEKFWSHQQLKIMPGFIERRGMEVVDDLNVIVINVACNC